VVDVADPAAAGAGAAQHGQLVPEVAD